MNIGVVEVVEHQGRRETTGIFKRPTAEEVVVTAATFGADVQADRRAHGGPDRVAYAYADGGPRVVGRRARPARAAGLDG